MLRKLVALLAKKLYSKELCWGTVYEKKNLWIRHLCKAWTSRIATAYVYIGDSIRVRRSQSWKDMLALSSK